MLQARFSVWSSEPLYYWYLSNIRKFATEESVKFLVAIAESKTNAAPIRSQALNQLHYSDYKEKRSKYGPTLLGVAKELASSNEQKVSKNALTFIGGY